MTATPLPIRTGLVAMAGTVVLCLGLSGCDGATDAETAKPARLIAIDEDGPEIRPEEPLPTPVTAQVIDDAGNPVPRVRVTWHATNGRLSRATSVSDSGGIVTTGFTAATGSGPTMVSALVPGIDSLTTLFELITDEGDALPYDRFVPVSVPTFNNLPEVVHPDVTDFPGHPSRRLALTPYPGGDFYQELPSLFESVNDLDWSLTPGSPNPLVPAPKMGGNMSDPDVLWNPDMNELWLYYRYAGGQNIISVIRSPDGIHWAAPDPVLVVPNHEAISPSVVRRGPRDWYMWVVNGGTAGCFGPEAHVELRRSTDGLHWSDPAPVALDADGFFPWHIDVQWIPSRREFWALYPAKEAGNCVTPVLYLATSRDGIRWTRASQPVAVRGVRREFRDVVYRSTFRYDPIRDDVWLWISGARHGRRAWRWTTLVQRKARRDLMDGNQLMATQARPVSSRYSLIRWP